MWEKVADDGIGTLTYIDGNFRLTTTHKIRVNIDQACTALMNGENPQILKDWNEYRLWHGAYFMGMFEEPEEVQRVVSQLRVKEMERKRR